MSSGDLSVNIWDGIQNKLEVFQQIMVFSSGPKNWVYVVFLLTVPAFN